MPEEEKEEEEEPFGDMKSMFVFLRFNGNGEKKRKKSFKALSYFVSFYLFIFNQMLVHLAAQYSLFGLVRIQPTHLYTDQDIHCY